MTPGPLDALVADILGRCGYRFTVADDDTARECAFRLRAQAVLDQGWAGADALPGGLERDADDAHAVHVLGWDEGTAIATGRLVLPPHRLPTESVCAMTIEPRGLVVDVGRMAVARSHQSHGHAVFLALLARLYAEVRQRGYVAGCGLVSARARSLMRLLGLPLDVLGDERLHWGEMRAPVRFEITGRSARPVVVASAPPLPRR
jgi:GNAT superfamily N-acetyltransferase